LSFCPLWAGLVFIMSPVGMACLSALRGQGGSLLCHLVGMAGLYYATCGQGISFCHPWLERSLWRM